MTALLWIGVAVGGGAGAALRFLVDGAVTRRVPVAFPAGTFVVNVGGALVLGVIAGLALDHETALLAGTAVVGSYTTFSTWMFETQRLAEERQGLLAVANIVLSVAAGLAAAAGGQIIGAQL